MGGRLIDADKLIELIDDDIASLNKDMSREGYDVCLCTLKMVKQYINGLPTVPLDWKSIMDDWAKHDNAMIAKGREIERRLNAPKHGYWIRLNGDSRFMCSVCKGKENVPTCNGEPTIWDYCPNCGVRMDRWKNE